MKRTIQIGERSFPAVWEICERCNGEGHHGNPAFDGTTTDWWIDGDPDGEDLENYVSGRWDVPCEDGCSNGKILVVDEAKISEEDQKYVDDYYQDMRELRWMEEAERAIGA